MSSLTKVSMNLTERDIQNTKTVRHLFHVRTNADAVSAALGITRSLGEMVKIGKEIPQAFIALGSVAIGALGSLFTHTK